MRENRAVYQNSQPPADGASNLPTEASIGSTAGDRARIASTSGAASATAKKRRSTRNADKPVTVEQALTVAQDIVRMAHRAGLHSHVVNLGNGDTAIVLCGVFYCPTCHNLSHGAVCQKCESQKSFASDTLPMERGRSGAGARSGHDVTGENMTNTDFENLRAHAQRGDYTNAALARRVQELENALDAAQDYAARLRAALQLVENDEEGYCLWCDGFYAIGHAPDCQRQAALAQTAQTSEVKA